MHSYLSVTSSRRRPLLFLTNRVLPLLAGGRVVDDVAPLMRVDFAVAGKRGQAAIRVLPAPPMQLICRDSQIGRHRRDRLRAFLAEANCFELVLDRKSVV